MFLFPLLAAAAGLAAAEEDDANEQIRRQEMRARNVQTRNLMNPFETLSEEGFRRIFRLTKLLAQHLCNRIIPLLPDEGNVTHIPKEIQVLTTLRFYASGSFQQSIADMKYFCLTQPNVSQIISDVTTAILTLTDEYIRFPETEEELEEISRSFLPDIGFPGVVGCIDGTHIALRSPVEEWWLYRNYKHFYSLNIQVTCDHKMRITSYDSYPGGVHDARIWNQSAVRDTMQALNAQFNGPYFLLGDAGYPLSDILLTPIPNADVDSPEFRYTQNHTHTRCIIERVFGILKGRFRCLHRDRVLLYSTEKTLSFFRACCILHNLMIENGLENNLDEEDPNEMDGLLDPDHVHHDHADGIQLRQRIINDYFT